MLVKETPCYFELGESKRLFLLVLTALLVVPLAFQAAGAAVPPPKSETVYIVSLWYGIFRAAEYQGGRPFVEVGDHVEPGTVVGIIEPLMTQKNEEFVAIPAGYKGTITSAVVREGEVVTIGQRLFQVLLDPPMTNQ